MATTTNYGWDTPDDTDLVKDGAAAIRTLGSSIDTTTKNLNPQTTTGALAYRSATANVNTALPIGTAGQILAVSGGVPAWINNDQGDITEVQAGTGISVASGTGPIPVVTNTVATEFDAKGDLVVGTGSDTFDRLAVGTNTYILTADSAEATGLKWAAPAASGSLTLLSTTSLSGTTNTISISASSYTNLFIMFRDIRANTNNTVINLRLNGDTGNNYYYSQWRRYMGGSDFQSGQNQPHIEFSNQIGTSSGGNAVSGSMDIYRCNDTSQIPLEFRQFNFNDSNQNGWYHTLGKYMATAAISSISLVANSTNTLSGTVYVYGVN